MLAARVPLWPAAAACVSWLECKHKGLARLQAGGAMWGFQPVTAAALPQAHGLQLRAASGWQRQNQPLQQLTCQGGDNQRQRCQAIDQLVAHRLLRFEVGLLLQARLVTLRLHHTLDHCIL
jgi:hypothetical protein